MPRVLGLRVVSGLGSSHYTGLDVLVADLLMVVGTAASMHGGGHGIKGEDKLLPVVHAGGLGVVPGDTL